jgi:hypothetical protein
MSITQNWSRENLAWAGGLFEGEGCISQKTWGTAVMRLQMTDEDTVRRFARIVGVGQLSGPHEHGVGRKQTWIWSLCKSDYVIAIIAALWPFLGIRRQSKATEVMKTFGERFGKRRRASHCLYGHEFTPENTFWSKGHRSCRECGRRKSRAYYWKKKNNGAQHIHQFTGIAGIGFTQE